MSDGLTKNLVLPLPEPPITRIFLFLAYFGCFGRLFMVPVGVLMALMGYVIGTAGGLITANIMSLLA